MSDEYVHFNNHTQPAINEDNLNRMQQLIKQDINGAVAGDTLPIGAIIPWTTTIAPNRNWLVCNGQAVSRTTYSQLFNIIGVQYGEGDGSTTFNVPDLRGRHPMGFNLEDTDFSRIGKTGGEKTHTMTVDELVRHRHGITPRNTDQTGLYEIRATNATGTTGSAFTDYTGNGQPFNVLDPYLTTNYIIKAFQTAGVVAEVVNTRSNSQTKVYSTNYINTHYLSATQLYKNDSGSAGTITLSETANNFKYIEIIYGADGFKYSSKVRPGDGFATGVQSVFSSSNSIALYTSNWTISGTSIAFNKASNKYINDSNTISSYGTDAYVRIYEVLGYK